MNDIYQIADEANELAGKWQDRANALQTPRERARQHKFVNLDMESYRDLAVTTQAFIRTLDQEEFWQHHAGFRTDSPKNSRK